MNTADFFEKGTGLLALSISDLLIINIWTKDVGLYKGS